MSRLLMLGSLLGLMAMAMAAPATPAEHGKKVVCYYASWARYRSAPFTLNHIDPNLCTHGLYAFATLELNQGHYVIASPRKNIDYDSTDCSYCSEHVPAQNEWAKFANLTQKNENFVPMLSIGGWDSGSREFSEMALAKDRREAFIQSAVNIAQKYGFKGFDLDWEWPVSRNDSRPEDKENFALLVEEMATELKKHGLILSVALAPKISQIQTSYILPRIFPHVEFASMITYQYQYWEQPKRTGSSSPLLSRPGEAERSDFTGSVVDTMNYMLDQGAPPEKLLVGVSSVASGYVLENPDQNGLYCPVKKDIVPGHYLGETGYWAYFEVVEALTNASLPILPGAVPGNWKEVRDGCHNAPYIVNGPYWFAYEDKESIQVKVSLVHKLGLAGAMFYTLDMDDFKPVNKNGEKYPLLKAVNTALASTEDVELPKPDTCLDNAGGQEPCA